MSNIYEIALQTGEKVTRSVESYFRRTNKANKAECVPFPFRKKKLTNGSTIFTFTGKWNPYRYDVDKGLIAVLERYNEKYEDSYAYMLVAVADDAAPDIIFNDTGFERFGELCPGVVYPEEWYEDKSNRKFDIVLLEKSVHEADGLSKKEVMKLYDLLKSETGFPLEIDNLGGGSTAIGFITPGAGDKLEWEYESLNKFVGRILSDMSLEHDDHIYRHKGLKIWLDR